MLLQPLSQVAQAARSTMVAGAEGADFDRVARFYGLPRPAGFSVAAWRRGLREVALGYRGRPGGMFAFLRGVFSDRSEVVPVTVAAANPQRITAVSGTPFEQRHVGRWVVLGDVVHLVVGPEDVAGAGGTYLELAALGTPAWTGATFLGSASHDAEILPFWIEEPTPGPIDWPNGAETTSPGEPGTLRVVVFADAVSSAPPTYLQSSGEARPVGQPYGGHVQTDAWQRTDTTAGPHALYLSGRAVFGGLRLALKAMVPPGIAVEVVRR
jgi:hypothetical protein